MQNEHLVNKYKEEKVEGVFFLKNELYMRHQARHHEYIDLALIAGRLLVEFLFRSSCLYLSMSSNFPSKNLGD